MSILLNLGCGGRVHPAWVNVDYSRLNALKASLPGRLFVRLGWFSPLPPNYLNHDLRKGIPAASGSASAVYCSHVLEHIDRRYVPGLLAEVWRVLRSDGIFRLSVPDLELVVHRYMTTLAACKEKPADPTSGEAYARAMLALFDQMVRTEQGGKMKALCSHSGPAPVAEMTMFQRLKQATILLVVPGNPAATGELHRWMYDEYSLKRLLERHGFCRVRQVSYLESSIPDWSDFYLGNNPDGTEYKPGSLYVEGAKP